MNSFVLHARLAADTFLVTDWKLSRVLLMNDARFPWLILVPRVDGATELLELSQSDRATLIEEIVRASAQLKAILRAEKINVGALGNLVPQLHVHVVARNPGDAAWPGPVWGLGQSIPYAAEVGDALIERLRRQL